MEAVVNFESLEDAAEDVAVGYRKALKWRLEGLEEFAGIVGVAQVEMDTNCVGSTLARSYAGHTDGNLGIRSETMKSLSACSILLVASFYAWRTSTGDAARARSSNAAHFCQSAATAGHPPVHSGPNAARSSCDCSASTSATTPANPRAMRRTSMHQM